MANHHAEQLNHTVDHLEMGHVHSYVPQPEGNPTCFRFHELRVSKSIHP